MHVNSCEYDEEEQRHFDNYYFHVLIHTLLYAIIIQYDRILISRLPSNSHSLLELNLILGYRNIELKHVTF
jgi:hypothetical protein